MNNSSREFIPRSTLNAPPKNPADNDSCISGSEPKVWFKSIPGGDSARLVGKSYSIPVKLSNKNGHLFPTMVHPDSSKFCPYSGVLVEDDYVGYHPGCVTSGGKHIHPLFVNASSESCIAKVVCWIPEISISAMHYMVVCGCSEFRYGMEQVTIGQVDFGPFYSMARSFYDIASIVAGRTKTPHQLNFIAVTGNQFLNTEFDPVTKQFSKSKSKQIKWGEMLNYSDEPLFTVTPTVLIKVVHKSGFSFYVILEATVPNGIGLRFIDFDDISFTAPINMCDYRPVLYPEQNQSVPVHRLMVETHGYELLLTHSARCGADLNRVTRVAWLKVGNEERPVHYYHNNLTSSVVAGVQHVGNYTNKCVVYDQQASIFETRALDAALETNDCVRVRINPSAWKGFCAFVPAFSELVYTWENEGGNQMAIYNGVEFDRRLTSLPLGSVFEGLDPVKVWGSILKLNNTLKRMGLGMQKDSDIPIMLVMRYCGDHLRNNILMAYHKYLSKVDGRKVIASTPVSIDGFSEIDRDQLGLGPNAIGLGCITSKEAANLWLGALRTVRSSSFLYFVYHIYSCGFYHDVVVSGNGIVYNGKSDYKVAEVTSLRPGQCSSTHDSYIVVTDRSIYISERAIGDAVTYTYCDPVDRRIKVKFDKCNETCATVLAKKGYDVVAEGYDYCYNGISLGGDLTSLTTPVTVSDETLIAYMEKFGVIGPEAYFKQCLYGLYTTPQQPIIRGLDCCQHTSTAFKQSFSVLDPADSPLEGGLLRLKCSDTTAGSADCPYKNGVDATIVCKFMSRFHFCPNEFQLRVNLYDLMDDEEGIRVCDYEVDLDVEDFEEIDPSNSIL